MSRASVALCMTGWHFSPDVYETVAQLKDVDAFVVSHRAANAVPAYVTRAIAADRVWCRPNLGYDWGCFQQFLDAGQWREYEVIVFMHDDVAIKDPAFIDRAMDLLGKYRVVGNGRPTLVRDQPSRFRKSYAHASLKPPSAAYEHDIVRGSFFVTTRAALEALGHFEVFWDPLRLNVGFGNSSVRASCARWSLKLGENCFGFLSETNCDSPYLRELVRGDEGNDKDRLHPAKQRLIRRIDQACTAYMNLYWQDPARAGQGLRLAALDPLVAIASGTGALGHLVSACAG